MGIRYVASCDRCGAEDYAKPPEEECMFEGEDSLILPRNWERRDIPGRGKLLLCEKCLDGWVLLGRRVGDKFMERK